MSFLNTGPDLAALQAVLLGLVLGLLVGIERERAGKEMGVRTFGLTGLIGALAGRTSPSLVIAAFALLGLIVAGNILSDVVRGETPELTTAVALGVVVVIGVMAGAGYVFEPVIAGISTAALLSWKQPLRGFALGLTQAEVRAAVTFGIIAFIVYPVLPLGFVDRWHLLNPREAWLTVVLVSAFGFVNYVLLRLYGLRGMVYGLFFGSLVNSSVAIAELAARMQARPAMLRPILAPALALAFAATILRNAVLLTLLALPAALAALPPLVTMLAVSLVLAISRRPRNEPTIDGAGLRQESPFSLGTALRFGGLFLTIAVGGDLAQRALGTTGFLVVSAVGGAVSSASMVATAATLMSQGKIDSDTAAVGAIVATITSGLLKIPLLWPVLAPLPGQAAEAVGPRAIVTLTTLLLVLAGAVGLALAWMLGWGTLVESTLLA